MIKAIIFDLDGLIVDSEPIHYKAHKMALEKYGIKLSKKDYLQFGVARGSKFFYETIGNKQNIKLDIPTVQKIKRVYFTDFIKTDVKLRDDFDKLIPNFYGKYKLAIASSTKKEIIELILKKFELAKYFDLIVSGEEVKNNKPNPDIYIETAKKLGVSVVDCLVIEDSQSGLIAAKKAGMKCIAIPNDFTKFQDFSKADLILNSLDELNLDVVLGL